MKYIVITGGVVSGVGKGVVASSIGCILKNLGVNVTFIKIDPYLNFDARNLSPNDHGEVFVLSDGGEVDLDFGNYERFMHINLRKENNLTTGKVYHAVISRERDGLYDGKTVQLVPHLTDYIIQHVENVAVRKVLNGRECNWVSVNNKSRVFNPEKVPHDDNNEQGQPISKINAQPSKENHNAIAHTEVTDSVDPNAIIPLTKASHTGPFSQVLDDDVQNGLITEFFGYEVNEDRTQESTNTRKKLHLSTDQGSGNGLKHGPKSLSDVLSSHSRLNEQTKEYQNTLSEIEGVNFSDTNPPSILEYVPITSEGTEKTDITYSVETHNSTIQKVPFHNSQLRHNFTPKDSLNTDDDSNTDENIEHLRENGLCGHKCMNSLEEPDVCIIELGGTVGDIESSLFVEALRQLKNKVGTTNFVTLSVEYIPILSNGEIKTKPVQNSVIKARGLGLQPDMLVLRCSTSLDRACLSKISNFCEIRLENIFHSNDVDSVYKVPGMLDSQNIGRALCDRLSLKPIQQSNLQSFFGYINEKYCQKISLAIVGKYIQTPDTYLSLQNALLFSAAKSAHSVEIIWVDAEHVEAGDIDATKTLINSHGIIIAGGFGKRGIEGKIKAITTARECKIPCLGICLGFQLQIIEYARNILNFKGATSEEFDSTATYKFIRMINRKGAESNLAVGTKQMHVKKDSQLSQIYQKDFINERYRHRYEFNPEYDQSFSGTDMVFSAYKVGSNKRCVGLELNNHPFFVGVQYHPEFLARPEHTHPLFDHFVLGCIATKQANSNNNINDR